MTTATAPSLRRALPGLFLLCLMAAVFAWLTWRSQGLNPTVFADEWYYSKMSRLQALSEAIVPSYLYLWLFRGSNACGQGFLACVRGANALLFVAAAPFVYLSARTVCARAVAAVVAVLATLAPLNLFTAYFMPEATYYVTISWWNEFGQEGGAAVPAAMTVSGVLIVRAAAAPQDIVGWKVYAGVSPDAMSQQGGIRELGEVCRLGAVATGGARPGDGQPPDYVHSLPRRLQRG